ncbi:MAG TPA: hypothetical protein PK509_18380 [Catalimonadaceae bacterium]|nr:hypothetical protein [Catalimonadaceae bacterium]
MIKHLLSKITFLLLLFVVCLAGSGSVYAQSKKESKSKSPEMNPGAANGAPAFPKAEEEKTPKVKTSQESYSFLVFFNSQDQLAAKVWEQLQTEINGLVVMSYPENNNAYVVSSRNPEAALFKRAYGSYFQIFSESDIDNLGQTTPWLAEMKPLFQTLKKKALAESH